MSDLRALILESDDIPKETLHVPQWGVEVLIQGMTGAERADLIRQFRNDNGSLNFEKLYPVMIVHTVCDPSSGERIFDMNDVAAINEKSGQALERVAKVALRLSGMDETAEEEAKERFPE